MSRAARLGVAALVAIVGMSLAWRALGPSTLPVAPANPSVPGPGVAVNDAATAGRALDLPLPSRLGDEVRPDNADQRVADIVRVVAQSTSLASLDPRERDAMLDEAKEQLCIYLTGSLDKYVERLRAVGAHAPDFLDPATDSEQRELARSSWQWRADSIAFRPISVRDVVVRPRFINGEARAQPGANGAVLMSAPERFGLGGTHDRDARAGGLTVYELLVPVQYEFKRDGRAISGPVWWGLWFARKPGPGQPWRPWRSVIYNPGLIDVGPAPMI